MIKKTLIITIAIFTLAAASLSANGTTDQTPSPSNNGSPAATPQITTAAQLAAELNAMNNGSVQLDGNTVTLTRIIGEIQRNLTVPEGVTLEITDDGALYFYNAALTVNGTVNAPSNKIGIDGGMMERQGKDTGWLTINGNGTINLTSKGILLGVHGSGQKITIDGVTLIGLADNDSPLVRVGDGGELILKSEKITGNVCISNIEYGYGYSSVIVDGNGTTFTMEGGAISGNSVTGSRVYGGGVTVQNNGAFTMEGGKISGNSVNGSIGASGGGVIVREGSVFTMEGGEISDNSATGRQWVNSGGVHASSNGTFIMSGGIISGNNISGGEAKGGGVKAEGGIFIMQGGVISGNNASGSVFAFGGGVYIESTRSNIGAFTMLGGRIQGSTDSDGFTKNTLDSPRNRRGVAINIDNYEGNVTAKWGTGGTYTIGGVRQTSGGIIGSTDDTLIAIPR